MEKFLALQLLAWNSPKLAIILIANLLVSTSVNSQNTPSNPAAAPASAAQNDSAERLRIKQNRADAETAYAAEKTACYQRFEVSGCLAKARDLRSSRLADLKRQEVSLNDMQRKRLGMEQLQRSEDKTSPEQQLAVSERRGQALAVNERRTERLVQQTVGREANGRAAQSRAGDMANKQSQSNSKAAAHQAKLARAAQNKARYEERLQEAKVKREKMDARLAAAKPMAEAASQPRALKKPSKSAAPLPIPTQ
jgi:colicin import membrane protein